MQQLVGIRRFTAKNTGKQYVALQILKDFNPGAIMNGCYGYLVQEVFLPDFLINSVSNRDVGQEILLDIEMNGKYAEVVGFRIVNSDGEISSAQSTHPMQQAAPVQTMQQPQPMHYVQPEQTNNYIDIPDEQPVSEQQTVQQTDSQKTGKKGK